MSGFTFVREPFAHYRWSANGVQAVFTLREGGISEDPFDELNLGLHVGDESIAVHENRIRVMAMTGIDDVRAAFQVHGTDVVGEPPDQWNGEQPRLHADALMSITPMRGIAVMVADCPPVVIATPDAVAVVHAGWRGLVAGILENTLEELNAPAYGVRAALGPCIGPCCFEVGEDVIEQFSSRFVIHPPGAPRPFVDLRGAIDARLAAAGVELDVLDVCTSCDERCFSHRRDEGFTGRQALVAWRTA